MKKVIKLDRLISTICDPSSNTGQINGLAGNRAVTIKLSLLDLEHVLTEMKFACQIQKQSLSSEEMCEIEWAPIEPQRLYYSQVKFNLIGDRPYIRLRLNVARPNEVEFVMWPQEAEALGEALRKEVAKLACK